MQRVDLKVSIYCTKCGLQVMQFKDIKTQHFVGGKNIQSITSMIKYLLKLQIKSIFYFVRGNKCNMFPGHWFIVSLHHSSTAAAPPLQHRNSITAASQLHHCSTHGSTAATPTTAASQLHHCSTHSAFKRHRDGSALAAVMIFSPLRFMDGE